MRGATARIAPGRGGHLHLSACRAWPGREVAEAPRRYPRRPGGVSSAIVATIVNLATRIPALVATIVNLAARILALVATNAHRGGDDDLRSWCSRRLPTASGLRCRQ